MNPPSVIDRNSDQARPSSEPSLAAATAMLSADEAADYASWTAPQKLQFLGAYQYLAVMGAGDLRRADGSPFKGPLSSGIETALSALDVIAPYIKSMMPLDAAAADQLATILKDASTKTQPKSSDFVSKYLLLRDRVAWELAAQYDLTVEFEIVGTDPAAPGIIYTRKVGEDRTPDYSAVFSTRSPKQLFDDGMALQDKFDALGVTFKRLDMSGANPRLGLGPALILAVLISIVVLILGFFWSWNQVNRQNDLTSRAVDLITSDSSLTPSEKADRIARLRGESDFFSQFFGSSIPWVPILAAAALAALAWFAYPYLVGSERRHGYLSGDPS